VDLSGYSFPLWVEVSPNPAGFPAAAEWLAEPPAGAWRLPEEVAVRLAGSALAVQVADATGREQARYALHVK